MTSTLIVFLPLAVIVGSIVFLLVYRNMHPSGTVESSPRKNPERVFSPPGPAPMETQSSHQPPALGKRKSAAAAVDSLIAVGLTMPMAIWALTAGTISSFFISNVAGLLAFGIVTFIWMAFFGASFGQVSAGLIASPKSGESIRLGRAIWFAVWSTLPLLLEWVLSSLVAGFGFAVMFNSSAPAQPIFYVLTTLSFWTISIGVRLLGGLWGLGKDRRWLGERATGTVMKRADERVDTRLSLNSTKVAAALADVLVLFGLYLVGSSLRTILTPGSVYEPSGGKLTLWGFTIAVVLFVALSAIAGKTPGQLATRLHSTRHGGSASRFRVAAQSSVVGVWMLLSLFLLYRAFPNSLFNVSGFFISSTALYAAAISVVVLSRLLVGVTSPFTAERLWVDEIATGTSNSTGTDSSSSSRRGLLASFIAGLVIIAVAVPVGIVISQHRTEQTFDSNAAASAASITSFRERATSIITQRLQKDTAYVVTRKTTEAQNPRGTSVRRNAVFPNGVSIYDIGGDIWDYCQDFGKTCWSSYDRNAQRWTLGRPQTNDIVEEALAPVSVEYYRGDPYTIEKSTPDSVKITQKVDGKTHSTEVTGTDHGWVVVSVMEDNGDNPMTTVTEYEFGSEFIPGDLLSILPPRGATLAPGAHPQEAP